MTDVEQLAQVEKIRQLPTTHDWGWVHINALLVAYDAARADKQHGHDIASHCRVEGHFRSAVAHACSMCLKEQDAAGRALVEAFTELLAKMDALKPAIDGAFQIQQLHGMPYKGSTWVQEVEAARAALASPHAQRWAAGI